jgi:phenylacetate-CoA ligase
LNELPILNKQNLQKPLTERLSNGFSIKDVSKTVSGILVFARDKYTMPYFGLLPLTVLVGMELI